MREHIEPRQWQTEQATKHGMIERENKYWN